MLHLGNFDRPIDHCVIKVKVMVGFHKCPHLPQYRLSGPITHVWNMLGS